MKKIRVTINGLNGTAHITSLAYISKDRFADSHGVTVHLTEETLIFLLAGKIIKKTKTTK